MNPTPRPPRPPPPEHAEFDRIRRRLGQAVAALVIVTIIGIVGFSIIGQGRYSIIDAAYMTVITLTTVGYGEIIDMSQNPAGRVFTMGLLLVGMGIVAYSVPLLAAFFIEGRLHHIFARRRMDKQIAQMRDHYIVCGDRAAAWYVADELLRTRRPFVLVTPTEAALAQALQWLGEVPRIVGDPALDDTLAAAGVERCAGVVVAMESDKDNVLVALTARRLAPRARIVASTESKDAEAKLRIAGADAVVSPARTGGLRIASELIRPKVVSFLDQMLRDARASLRVEEVTVPPVAPAVGKSIGALGINDVEGALLVAIRDSATGTFTFKPSSETPLRADTTLVVMVDADGRARLEKRLKG